MTNTPQQFGIYSAIADPTRRALLERLGREGERTVTQLLQPLTISQPAVSKHLRILREAGLVGSRKMGRQRLYVLRSDRLREIHQWVSQFEKYWDAKLDALGEYLEKRQRANRKS